MYQKILFAFLTIAILIVIFTIIVCVKTYKYDSVCYLVLNLERSLDRNELCKIEFNKYNITDYYFVKGIDGTKYSTKDEILSENNYSSDFCINGTKHIGCYLSHLRAIKEFYHGKYNLGIILEDDFSFDCDPIKYINEFKLFFEDDEPRMIVLSNNTKNTTTVIEKFNVPAWNAVGYMINKKAASVLLEGLTPDSSFLNTHFNKTDCLYDFALFKLMQDRIKWKWFTLISQRPQLVSTITEYIRNVNAIKTNFIDASNYTFDMCTHATNLGDTASKEFVEKLCNVKFGTGKIVGAAITIGSILTYSRNYTIVWGSGFLNEKQQMKYGVKKIYSVRGPKSYNKLIAEGVDCPKIFGDPFFIVPLLYNTNNTKKIYDIGIIPHYMDKDSVKLSEYIKKNSGKKIKMIDIQTTNIQKFIDELSECSEIHSSSLHGVIISLAYKIPTCWVKFTDKTGDGFKYYDFFESVGIQDYKIGTVINRVEKNNMMNIGIQIIRSCPFMHDVLKNNYCSKWNIYCKK